MEWNITEHHRKILGLDFSMAFLMVKGGGCLNITHIILRTYFLRLVAYVCCMDDMQESEANHFHFPSHLSL